MKKDSYHLSFASVRKAFSLIELSIVILIIGILVASIAKSDKWIRSARLTSAKNSTNSARAAFGDNSVLWLESTIDDAFEADATEDDKPIKIWSDGPFSKNDARVAAGSVYAKYRENGIGNIPAIEFNGGNISQALSFNGNVIAGGSFMVYIVERSNSPTDQGENCILGNSVGNSGEGVELCIKGTDPMFCYGSDCGRSSTPVAAGNVARMHVFIYDASASKAFYKPSGGTQQELASSVVISSYRNAIVGGGVTKAFKGAIGEVIIFNKVLKEKDQSAVESYLKRKWQLL